MFIELAVGVNQWDLPVGLTGREMDGNRSVQLRRSKPDVMRLVGFRRVAQAKTRVFHLTYVVFLVC